MLVHYVLMIWGLKILGPSLVKMAGEVRPKRSEWTKKWKEAEKKRYCRRKRSRIRKKRRIQLKSMINVNH